LVEGSARSGRRGGAERAALVYRAVRADAERVATPDSYRLYLGQLGGKMRRSPAFLACVAGTLAIYFAAAWIFRGVVAAVVFVGLPLLLTAALTYPRWRSLRRIDQANDDPGPRR
jgi:Flp pilus assembly protein TadB